MHSVGVDANSAAPLRPYDQPRHPDICDDQPQPFRIHIGAHPHLPEVIGLPSGGIISAAYGARAGAQIEQRALGSANRLSARRLRCALCGRRCSRSDNASLVPASATVYLLAGIAIGGIGLVSSVLAVAGGEPLIQTLSSSSRRTSGQRDRRASCLCNAPPRSLPRSARHEHRRSGPAPAVFAARHRPRTRRCRHSKRRAL